MKDAPQDDAPILITEAAPSYQEEFAARRRRYTIMMALRVPCLILAAVFYQTPWLAVLFLVLSIPLPWMAVLIANDRAPRRASKFSRYAGDRAAAKALEAREHPVIDS